MSLYISTATASSEIKESSINQAITMLAATMAIKTRHGMIPDGPSLDVTFMLPGKYDKPNFTGMRMGNYNEKGNTLFFERSVPDHIVHSAKANEYVTIVMQDVINQANEFFKEESIAFDIQKWEELIDSLVSETSSVDYQLRGLANNE